MKRRNFIKHGALWVPTLLLSRKSSSQFGLQSPGFVSQLSNKVSSGGVETLWIQQTAVTDYNDMSRQFAQKFKVSSAKEISKIEIYFFCTGTRVVRLGLWSASNATGTQYGSWSGSETIPNTSAVGWVTFTFATNPSVSSDCYLIIDPVSGSGAFLSYKDTVDGTAYEDENYSSYDNQIGSVQEPLRDRVFKVYTLE